MLYIIYTHLYVCVMCVLQVQSEKDCQRSSMNKIYVCVQSCLFFSFVNLIECMSCKLCQRVFCLLLIGDSKGEGKTKIKCQIHGEPQLRMRLSKVYPLYFLRNIGFGTLSCLNNERSTISVARREPPISFLAGLPDIKLDEISFPHPPVQFFLPLQMPNFRVRKICQ